MNLAKQPHKAVQEDTTSPEEEEYRIGLRSIP